MFAHKPVIIIEVEDKLFKFKSMKEINKFVQQYPNGTVVKIYMINRIMFMKVDISELRIDGMWELGGIDG